MFGFFGKSRKDPARRPLEDVNLDLPRIAGAIETVDRLPRVHWKIVREAVKGYSTHPAIDDIWTELAAQWLGVLGDYLGTEYKLHESKHLLLLTPLTPVRSAGLLETGDAAYDRLEKLLQRTPEQRGHGKHAVIVLKDNKTYYDYVSYFHKDEERTRASSAGVFIRRGYRHTVINGINSSLNRSLAHEMAHNMVSHLPLPLWLNEGVAQLAEDMIPDPQATPILNRRQARLQRRYWSWFGLQHFWTGESFSKVSSQRVSYQLSDILFRNILSHKVRAKCLGKFLAAADRKDAGQAACRECFACTLSALAEEFLGPGDWDPCLEADGKLSKS